MKDYKAILVALDIYSDYARELAQLAVETVKTGPHRMWLAYVCEKIPLFDFDFPQTLSEIARYEDERYVKAQIKLATIGAEIGVPESRQLIRAGHPKEMLLDMADQVFADLIILGNHTPQLQTLTGSTSKPILQHANCDVLAVRLHEGESITQQHFSWPYAPELQSNTVNAMQQDSQNLY